MINDLATYFIGVHLFGCVVTMVEPFQNLKDLITAGIVCMSLAGKYYSIFPPHISGVAQALESHDMYGLANMEARFFQLLGGKMNHPSSYRFLIEIFNNGFASKCNLSQAHQHLFGWSVGLLCAVEMSKGAFVGTPSDLARLAIQLAAHYLEFDLTGLPAAAMEPRELIQGAKLVHGSYSTLRSHERQSIVQIIDDVIQRTVTTVTSDRLDEKSFLLLLEGKLHASS
jgi:hypothetical protein